MKGSRYFDPEGKMKFIVKPKKVVNHSVFQDASKTKSDAKKNVHFILSA